MAFPSILGRDGVTSAASDATSFTVPIAAGWAANLAGDRLFAFVSADGNPTLTTATSGWTKVAQQTTTTQVTGALFDYVVAGDNAAIPDLVVASDQAQQYSARMVWARSATGAIATLLAQAGGSNTLAADPPAIGNASGAAQDVLVIASYHGDSTPAPTGAPAHYADLSTQAASGTGGATTSTAERQVVIAKSASEDPGAFPVGVMEQWSAFTLGLFETGGGATMGRVKYWDGSAWMPKPVSVWDGGAWISKAVKIWDGSAWVAA